MGARLRGSFFELVAVLKRGGREMPGGGLGRDLRLSELIW